MIIPVCCIAIIIAAPSFAQTQACPVNINFASGDLRNWTAATGLFSGGRTDYTGTGLSVISEYNLPATTGIRVITTNYSDTYGFFETIPTINGYSYKYSILLGSTATSWDLNPGGGPGGPGGNPGGFTRAVTYNINVPAGDASEPYTMTYAYAMVLENGTHNSSQQPLFKATLATKDSVITCASPQYYLPTFNDAGGGGGGGGTGATLDTATSLANGFTNSPVLYFSHAGNRQNGGQYLQDVWTKGWTEVTFDLSPYRGQQVTLTFEADNCIPGGHFAYAYVAVRNDCAGLEISGVTTACTNNTFTYSIPALASAVYEWEVPSGWHILSGANTNSIVVEAGPGGGKIIAREINGCADLRDTITVNTSPPTVAGQITSDNTVCAGFNNTALRLGGERGTILTWLSSTDGVNWTSIPNTGNTYRAQNLTITTQYRALVQNGSSCRVDTSGRALITVDPVTRGGMLSPVNSYFCMGQSVNSLLTLLNSTGAVVNWQFSSDNINWNNFSPPKTDFEHSVTNINATAYYRTIVKSGVCPVDTSEVGTITYVNVPFPAATVDPEFASICYADSIKMNANITIGTNYSWRPVSTIVQQGNGVVPFLPYITGALVKPALTTDYILTVTNNGCPNTLQDTAHIVVAPPIIVFAGNDTSVVVGQPLRLNATVNDPAANLFTWTPGFGLSSTTIANPIATYGAETGASITYRVTARRHDGCTAIDDIRISIFKTAPEIFIPTAFTPNGDSYNNVMRPICVGISRLNFFRVYNRWGQLIFTTSEIGKGWDGTIGGVKQSTGSYVCIVQGIDYTGKPVSKKGSFVLVR
jgi:gliding motility-associated-like protein